MLSIERKNGDIVNEDRLEVHIINKYFEPLVQAGCDIKVIIDDDFTVIDVVINKVKMPKDSMKLLFDGLGIKVVG